MVTIIIHYLPYRFCTPDDKYDKYELPDRISLRCSRTCHSKPTVCLRRRLDRIRVRKDLWYWIHAVFIYIFSNNFFKTSNYCCVASHSVLINDMFSVISKTN